MNDATRLLNAAASGDPRAAKELLPMVYDQLKKLAAAKMANERAGHTLTATALVHEAYMRLIGPEGDSREPPDWDGRSHFFACAAEAMRRILVEHARKKKRIKHGGQHRRVELDDIPFDIKVPAETILEIDQGLDELAQVDEAAARIVNLHYFVGMTMVEAAAAMNVSERTAYRKWNFARTWLYNALDENGQQE